MDLTASREIGVLSVGRRERYVLLEPLRAVAALMVLGYHVYLRSGPDPENTWDAARLLNMGVPIFFVLSGFLLYRPFAAARLEGRPRPDIGRYAKRRFFRIVPGYWVALTVFALVIPTWVDVLHRDAWIYYGLAQTWVPGHTFEGLSPAWSLSVEVAFYLLLPLYALVLHRTLGGRPARTQLVVEVGILCAAAVFCLLARRFLFGLGEGPTGFLAWSLLGHLDWFAAGMALALATIVWSGGKDRPRPVRLVEQYPGTCWSLAVAIFLLLGFIVGSPGDILHVAGVVIALLLVAPAVFGDQTAGRARNLLSLPVMVGLGAISYGIFLWNEPIAVWLQSVGAHDWGFVEGTPVLLFLTVVLTVLAAVISYFLVERPMMAYSRRGNR
ncbi:acyltransferase family protein [Rhodococcus rhodochrous]|uniref:acyltransferase family protein n=1 Tax=Rhodococcus rhodochrous TaxID=1829 RepID=UPI0009B6796F|nr:acyltransferase [Rhodococcus rhodochrous]